MFIIKYSLISTRATDWTDGTVNKASAVLQCTSLMMDYFCKHLQGKPRLVSE